MLVGGSFAAKFTGSGRYGTAIRFKNARRGSRVDIWLQITPEKRRVQPLSRLVRSLIEGFSKLMHQNQFYMVLSVEGDNKSVHNGTKTLWCKMMVIITWRKCFRAGWLEATSRCNISWWWRVSDLKTFCTFIRKLYAVWVFATVCSSFFINWTPCYANDKVAAHLATLNRVVALVSGNVEQDSLSGVQLLRAANWWDTLMEFSKYNSQLNSKYI